MKKSIVLIPLPTLITNHSFVRSLSLLNTETLRKRGASTESAICCIYSLACVCV